MYRSHGDHALNRHGEDAGCGELEQKHHQLESRVTKLRSQVGQRAVGLQPFRRGDPFPYRRASDGCAEREKSFKE
jgi:hypothetical protein